jgi:TonB-linked SusC/RagA family outer membrane protein
MSPSWRVLAGACAMLLVPAWAAAQDPATISGQVVTEAGAPIVSVSVYLEGAGIGTATNAEGRYVLIVPASRVTGEAMTLSVRLIGYRSASATVTLQPGTSITRDFQLAADPLRLEAVVVTGLGTQIERQRLGVAISSVAGEDVNRVPTSNIVNALAAKAPGMQVTSAAGDPGASALIVIRGVKTITGSSQPLFVVDGVPINNSESLIPSTVQYGTETYLAGTISPNRAIDINPSDIESIEVLKGPAAGAVYGARAANGVILITTKSGRAGVTRSTLTTSYSIDRVNKNYPLQRSFGQGNLGVSNPFALRSWGQPITTSYDHYGELFESGRIVDTNLSLSGGSERTTYYLSVGYNDHNGFIVGDKDAFKRYSARLKAAHRLTDEVRISGNFAYAQTEGSFIQKGSNLSGILLGGMRTPPDFNNFPHKTPEGFHRSYTNQEPESLYDWWYFDNPFWSINELSNTSQVGRAYGNVSAEYNPFSWLGLVYTLGIDYANDERLESMPPGNYTYVYGYLGKGDFINHQVNHTASATGRHWVTPTVEGILTVGYERNLRRYSRFFVEGLDFVVPYLNQLDNTVTRTPNEYKERINAESFYGQAVVNIEGQLFLTAAARNDGFSTFGASNQRHWYPKASAAWEFTRTLGLAGNSVLNYGKLRTAWGQAGNEPPAYATLAGFTAGDLQEGWGPFLRSIYSDRGALRTDFSKEQPDIRPERTSELEIGADFSLLHDRVGLGFTWYNAKTDDAILFTPLPPSSGYFSQIANAATFRNRGYEITLDVRAVNLPKFTWEVGGNFASNRNRVVDFGDPDVEFIAMGGFSGAAVYAVRGSSIGVFRGQDFVRCGNDLSHLSAEIQTGCAGASSGAYYIGVDGFPVGDPRVREIGNPNPDWTAGVRTSMTFLQRWRLSGLLDIQQGIDMWNGTKGALYSYGTHKDTEVRGLQTTWGAFKGAEVVGPGADRTVTIDQTWFLGAGSGFGPYTNQFVEDASFVKLREIALEYDVPTSFAQRFGMTGINLRVAGRNLKTWTDYTGLDPETNLTGTLGGVRGYDYFNNPQSRQFVFTVGLTR